MLSPYCNYTVYRLPSYQLTSCNWFGPSWTSGQQHHSTYRRVALNNALHRTIGLMDKRTRVRIIGLGVRCSPYRTPNSKGKKGRYTCSSSWEPHLRATGRHLPYGITQRYLPPDTSESAPPNPSHAGWYSIYLPLRNGRLSWPSWLDSAPAGSRTSDLSITSPTPNHCTTKTTK